MKILAKGTVTVELTMEEVAVLTVLTGDTLGGLVVVQNLYDELAKLCPGADDMFEVDRCTTVRRMS